MKLLATDLDGTLLLPDATVSPRVVKALAEAQAAGITVVILTARNWRTVRDLAAAAGVSGLAVCSNGAVVYDLANDRVARAHPFDTAELDGFLTRVRSVLDVAIGWETAEGAYRTARYHELAQRDPNFAPAYLSAIEFAEAFADDHVVTKMMVRHDTMPVDELLAAIEPLAEGVTVTVSGGTFVEVMAPGVTKAFTLAALCAELGIDAADVVAVGDHTNDLPMLRWAGRGVAMANAHPSVLRQISEHTASNLDDGLALVAESLLA